VVAVPQWPGPAPGNLPADLTSFVDRRAELGEIQRLLSGSRLVTLTGPAGVGKSRLARRVGQRMLPRYPDGVWLVEVGGVAQAALIGHAVAGGLRIEPGPGPDPLAPLREALLHRRVLLILDDCEQVAPACAALVCALLRSARGLSVLATSQQALRAPGEHLWQVRPLPVPEPEEPGAAWPARSGWSCGTHGAAAELFARRAAAVLPGFAVTAENRPVVAEICRRLDGNPLAIELAAGRLRAMSLGDLRHRLDDRFRLLTGGSSARPPHRALLAAVDASHRMCRPAERLLWARASAFTGGFTLAAAEEVCAGAPIAAADLLDLLDSLVGKSILAVQTDGVGPVRYRLSETLRLYGRQHLGGGAAARVAAAHAQHFLRLAERAEREWFTRHQAQTLHQVAREHENLRASLDFLLGRPDPSAARRMAAALWFHWLCGGRGVEGRVWLARILRLSGPPTGALARALWTAGSLTMQQGDLVAAENLGNQARDVAVHLGDRAAAAGALQLLGAVATGRGDLVRAGRLLAGALAEFEQAGQATTAPAVLVLTNLGHLRLARGDQEGSRQTLGRAEEICRGRGDRLVLAGVLLFRARTEWAAGAVPAAAEQAREAVRLAARLPTPASLALAVEMLAWIAAGTGEGARAALLLGAAGRLRRAGGPAAPPGAALLGRAHRDCVAATRRGLTEALGESGAAAHLRRGQRLRLVEILELAGVAAGAPEQATPPAGPGSGVLTRRECEVARLVADGLSNKEIAARLAISQRTAESHVKNILAKLHFGSRAQVAAWMATEVALGAAGAG
jgi:predicted ATPase/DNA-binding CsgD family transcriptional regulator